VRGKDDEVSKMPPEGEGASFAKLWARHGGDVPLTSMRKELERAGAITILPDGTVRAEKRYFMPRSFDPQWVQNAGSMLRDLGAGISKNLDAGPTSGSALLARRFIGRASSETVDPAALAEFESFVEQNGQEFLEKVDRWLTEHEARGAPTGARKTTRLGVGVFLIAGD
ncbi:MAG: DUF6502 family protein, partial [Gammaproteobacteria bacterium]